SSAPSEVATAGTGALGSGAADGGGVERRLHADRKVNPSNRTGSHRGNAVEWRRENMTLRLVSGYGLVSGWTDGRKERPFRVHRPGCSVSPSDWDSCPARSVRSESTWRRGQRYNRPGLRRTTACGPRSADLPASAPLPARTSTAPTPGPSRRTGWAPARGRRERGSARRACRPDRPT